MLIFDNAPVYIITTIHTGAGVTLVYKKIWCATENAKVPMPIPRLLVIDEYNHNMNNVDRNDQLSKNYNLDGVSMRDRKWWHPILKGILKRAVVQAYLLYKKVCELAEAARIAPRGDSPAARSRGMASQTIKPMPHMEFQEKVAGGLIIMAFNALPSTHTDEELPLDSDPVKALEFMSIAKPSGTGRGGLTSSGSAASKRSRPLSLGEPVESRRWARATCSPTTRSSSNGSRRAAS
jgi:hypothetical protein